MLSEVARSHAVRENFFLNLPQGRNLPPLGLVIFPELETFLSRGRKDMKPLAAQPETFPTDQKSQLPQSGART